MSPLLFLAALIGGALNSVAGGGSFIALPALLFAGIAPVTANATTTFALWPGAVASAIAYRRDVKTPGKWLFVLGAVSLVGGFLGGLLLVHTSDTSFMRLLPWLMLLAAATFTFGDAIGRKIGRGRAPAGLSAWAILPQLVIAIYGGYFGGGIGIMMLATLAIAGKTDIHEMNGLKLMLAAAINGVALAEFVLHGVVAWTPGLLMAAGGIIGGYAGASIARRLDRAGIRLFVIVVGWGMTAYFFLQ